MDTAMDTVMDTRDKTSSFMATNNRRARPTATTRFVSSCPRHEMPHPKSSASRRPHRDIIPRSRLLITMGDLVSMALAMQQKKVTH